MDPMDLSKFVASKSGKSVREIGTSAGRSPAGFAPYIYKHNQPSLTVAALLCDVCGFDLLVRQRDTGEETIIDPPLM